MSLDDPILLFGMPRSGTTWLGKIFDSHTRTVYRHEPDTYRPIDFLPLLPDPGLAESEAAQVRAYLHDVADMRVERVCAKQPIFPKAYSTGAGTGLYKLGAVASKAAGRLGVALPVLGAPKPGPGNEWRLVWKSIESLGRLGTLLEALPGARAVQILRHPCGFVGSVQRGEAAQQFTHGGAAEDYGIFELLCATPQARRRGLELQDFRAMHPSERLAWRWVLFNEKAADDCGDSGRVLRLYYEQLCAAPERMTREMFAFCGLPWDAQTHLFLQQSTSTAKTDYYSVFKDPLESAWKWRKELPRQDIDRIMGVVVQSTLGAPYTQASEWNQVA